MMTTWCDHLLNNSSTHTWMAYIPGLPRDLDYPEELGLRVPAANPGLQQHRRCPFYPAGDGAGRPDLREVFAKAEAADRYRGPFHPGDHKFDLPMQAEAFDWFDKWLK